MIQPVIIFEDAHIMAVNKPAGIPVQNDKTFDLSLQQLLENKSEEPLFILNRIDRPVSGVTVFAKNKNVAGKLSELIRQHKTRKTYLAAVENKPPDEKGKLSHSLIKKNNKAFVDPKSKKAKQAVLEYVLIGKSDRYYFLNIQLITGRFHQIRAQLSDIQCPVKGDVKYGARRANKDRSIHLHAYKIEFNHPVSGQKLALIAELPDDPVWNALELTLS